MEHLYGILAACSSQEDAIAKDRAEAMKGLKTPTDIRDVMVRFEERTAETYDDATAAALFARLKKNGTWQCPTLTVHQAIAHLDDKSFTDDPRLKYLPPWMRAFWDPKNDFRLKAMTARDFARLKESFRRFQKLAGRMRRAGVEFLAGTDELNP